MDGKKPDNLGHQDLRKDTLVNFLNFLFASSQIWSRSQQFNNASQWLEINTAPNSTFFLQSKIQERDCQPKVKLLDSIALFYSDTPKTSGSSPYLCQQKLNELDFQPNEAILKHDQEAENAK